MNITNTKKEKYSELKSEIKGLMDPQCSHVTNMANFSAALMQKFNFWWCGFYLIKDPQTLELGPFQGPVACTQISMGKGVCGKSWETRSSIVVDDVHSFPGHIACSEFSNSEIVIPFYLNGAIAGVFDVDSTTFGAFDSTDQNELETLLSLIPS